MVPNYFKHWAEDNRSGETSPSSAVRGMRETRGPEGALAGPGAGLEGETLQRAHSTASSPDLKGMRG